MQKPTPRCIHCNSPQTVKRGVRSVQKGPTQLYQCKKCSRRFSVNALPFYTFPPEAILSAPVYYSLGYSIKETKEKIAAQFKQSPAMATVANWINSFSRYSAMKRYRSGIVAFDKPQRIIRRILLRHRQNYLFQVHAFKCSLLTENTECLRHYFYGILNGERPIKPEKFTLRASALDLSFLFTHPVPRQVYPCRLASIGIKSAATNAGRHLALQRFFLAMDRSTVATEVPVYLTTEETEKILRQKGGLLGHIDFLQVFNDRVTILDYKPGAITERRVHEQLLLYAIALSTRTGIHLKNITCAWFDEKDYFQFQAMEVYKTLRKRIWLRSKISNTP